MIWLAAAIVFILLSHYTLWHLREWEIKQLEKKKKKQSGNGVSFPLMITRDQHQQLADLGYTREQRRNMTPEQAHNILKERT